MISSTCPLQAPTKTELQARFLALVPRIEAHAAIYFRHIPCADRKADKINECVALAWRWFLRLHERGKDIASFTMVFIFLVARAVKCGRRICGLEKSGEVLNPRAQQRHGFKVASLLCSTGNSHERLSSAPHGQHKQGDYEEALKDNSITPVPDQVVFRLDFPEWCKTLTDRDRRLVYTLMTGERTQDVAARFGLTPGRISQKRLAFYQDWQNFTRDTEPGSQASDTNCV